MNAFDFGPRISEDGVEFRLWAPKQPQVKLLIEDRTPIAMERDPSGWHRHFLGGAKAGMRYRFQMPDGLEVPDPGSRYQPEDAHGPSEVIDLDSHAWAQTGWKGRPWEETVLYELHIGTFTQEGTFRAAAERLDHLRDLGVTAIQIMPLADFPGGRGWGYDGVLPYAPEGSYGRPEDLMALVDGAHERGISVFLDVVYNHFGPDGNYLPVYAPLFTERHETPWGAGINYDGEASELVREFAIQNAIYWTVVFRIDGLRLDAVHAIQDDSGEHLLHALARRVREAAGDRHVHLVVENENNDSALLARDDAGKAGLYNAQWNDDIHHVLHIAATGERFAYYGDYETGPVPIARALAEGFVFQGQHMSYRGETRGTPSTQLPPTAFVSFIQNHDQIGNRAMGDRMIVEQPLAPMKALAAIYLLAPQVPMLFMGEEWGAKEPFPYFCDFNEDLNQKVREGRKRELSRLPGFDAEHAFDATAEETFRAAKLDWAHGPEQAKMLDFYRDLLALRHRQIVPGLKGMGGQSGRYDDKADHIEVSWTLSDGRRLSLIANLSAESVAASHPPAGEPLFAVNTGDDPETLAPWAVIFTLQ